MNLAEKLANLFPGVTITEEFTQKLSALLESTVAARIEEKQKQLEEEYATKINQIQESSQAEIDHIKEKAEEYADFVVSEMTEKVDQYAQLVVEEFIEENKVNLIKEEEYNRMTTVMENVKEVFEKNYIKFDESSGNVKLTQDLNESVNRYNELFTRYSDLKKELENKERASIFESIASDLTDTQKERVSKLMENASFPSVDSYKAGLKLMVEEIKINKSQPKTPQILTESKNVVSFEGNGKMQEYLKKL